MSSDGDRRARSTLIGHLVLPSDLPSDAPRAVERVPVLLELNALYPGGLDAVTGWFFEKVWTPWYPAQAGVDTRQREPERTLTGRTVPVGLRRVTQKLYQCVLTRGQVRELVDLDMSLAPKGLPVAIFKVWPDYELRPQIDRSAPTVKADAAWRSYEARGRRIVWAVIDSGIDARHGHFSALEIAAEAKRGARASTGAMSGRTAGLHRDFRELVSVADDAPQLEGASPLTDEQGHGTHVAGIIAGQTPAGKTPVVASSKEPPPGRAFVRRESTGVLSGMAPQCELVSLKVLREDGEGSFVTSSAAVIAALDYLRTQVNVDASVLRVHGVNISLGCPWAPSDYAAGQSPLSQAVNQLVDSGVVVVVSAGNAGAGFGDGANAGNAVAVLGSITEPAHAQECIAVGSTHRDAPHAFGVTWTSSKGPTLDGRMKPDVVAPGEWITSASTGKFRMKAGLQDEAADLTYAEESGTSMAAPHVSGVIAAFLSARPEFIGRPRRVKEILLACATDLGRERYAQGAGLVDLMRMLSNV